MATLTEDERLAIRKRAAEKAQEFDVPIRWVKAALNDSAQAVEDVLSSVAVQTAVSDDIDTASGAYGVTFTAQEKRWIAALVMATKYTRDIVG
jgi:hypothetical protein